MIINQDYFSRCFASREELKSYKQLMFEEGDSFINTNVYFRLQQSMELLNCKTHSTCKCFDSPLIKEDEVWIPNTQQLLVMLFGIGCYNTCPVNISTELKLEDYISSINSYLLEFYMFKKYNKQWNQEKKDWLVRNSL